MKKSVSTWCCVFTMALMLFSSALHAEKTLVNSNEKVLVLSADTFIGTWAYTAENTLPEYSKGLMVISKKNGAYAVQIKLPNGNLTGNNVKVNGNAITFDIYVQGEAIGVELKVKGNSMSGQSSTPEGVVEIKGEREKES